MLTLHLKNNIYAEAVSAADFKYQGYVSNEKVEESVGKETSNLMVSSTTGWSHHYKPHNEFIDMLAKENNAEINEDRTREDGLIAHNKLESILDILHKRI